MNERIKELAGQAREYVEDAIELGFPKDQVDDIRDEKFAELIIQECVDQMELVRKYRYDRIQPFENQQTIIDECQYQIKQHFGIES